MWAVVVSEPTFIDVISQGQDRPRQRFSAHNGVIASVRFSPNGDSFATASHDGTIKLWNTLSTELRGTLEGARDWITCVAFSRDGETILGGTIDGRIISWDVATMELLGMRTAHDGPIYGLTVSPDGRTIATA